MFGIFYQNNSGGYFHNNLNEGPIVVIEGRDLNDIEHRAEDLLDNSDSCKCCGDRWSSYFDEVEVDWKKHVRFGFFNDKIVFHAMDGTIIHYIDKINKHRFADDLPMLDEYKEVEEKIMN